MIKKLAQRILELLKQNTGLSQQEINNPSIELSKIINMILSECKCSLVDSNGNYIRYGSSIDIDDVQKIIITLISEKNEIPNEIIVKALAKEGIQGPNVSVQFNKRYNATTKITELEIQPIMPDNFEDYFGKNNSDIQTKLMDEVLKPYVKELIFSNEILTKRSPIGAFISKSFFRKKSTVAMKETYIKILQKYIKDANEDYLKNSVNYIVDNILQNPIFKKELINSSINSTELQILGRVYTGFNGLVYNMITSTISKLALKESPNKDLVQIQDIYYTIIGVLTAISTDITELDESEIQEKIKIINRNFNIIPNKFYPEKSEYRKENISKNIYGNSLRFVEPENIQIAMQKLCTQIGALIVDKDKISNTDFIKETMRINYRFIRIRPFKSANGRSSRTLINMLLQVKGMSAYFAKEIKVDYLKSIMYANETIAQSEEVYIYNLSSNPLECAKYEEKYLKQKIPLLIVKD